jgi:DNA-binding NarL/FixJ family response regulator
LSGAKIILVDNNIFFRNGLKNILQNLGNVDIIGIASDGIEFIEILEKNKPDIVFIDIQMPNLNGFEAAKMALEIFPDLIVIAFSGYEEDSYIKKMVDIGAKGYLSKSRNNIEILKKIIVNRKQGYFFSEELNFEI